MAEPAIVELSVTVARERLWADVMALAELTDPALPYTRRSFTPRFLTGREFLHGRFAEAGLTVRIDTAGNLIGRREGSKPGKGTLMIGSHSDTVPGGGRFDGIAGVLAGLEIARTLRERSIELEYSLEIVDFLAEEPSVYGVSCVGSRGMSGCLEPGMLDLTGPGGERLAVALRRVGGDPDQLDAAHRSDLVAFFELHIEQGAVLEAGNTQIGIVTGIVGITRIEIEFTGEADHAGTTPFSLRRDALVPAARTIAMVRDIAARLAEESNAYFIATVGVVKVEPGAANVVPRQATLIVDTRTSDRSLRERFIADLAAGASEFAQEACVERSRFDVLSDSLPAQCDTALQELLRAGAERLGLSSRSLPSGAGHDAAFMTRLAPTAMVFIPCLKGKSHSPVEWTEPQQLADGTNTLLQAVLSLQQANMGEVT